MMFKDAENPETTFDGLSVSDPTKWFLVSVAAIAYAPVERSNPGAAMVPRPPTGFSEHLIRCAISFWWAVNLQVLF